MAVRLRRRGLKAQTSLKDRLRQVPNHNPACPRDCDSPSCRCPHLSLIHNCYRSNGPFLPPPPPSAAAVVGGKDLSDSDTTEVHLLVRLTRSQEGLTRPSCSLPRLSAEPSNRRRRPSDVSSSRRLSAPPNRRPQGWLQCRPGGRHGNASRRS